MLIVAKIIETYNRMVFFGAALVEGESIEISVPPGYCLKILQANVDLRQLEHDYAMLFVQTPMDDAEVILGSFTKRAPCCSFAGIDFSPDDNPVIFRAEGGVVHMSGNWIIDEEGSDGSLDDDDEAGEEEDSEDDGMDSAASESSAEVPELEVVGKKIKISSTDNAVSPAEEKKTGRNKRGRNGQKIDETALPAPSIVVATKPTADTSHLRKKWNVKPQNDEGLLVQEPKAVAKASGVVIVDHVIGKGKEPKLGAKVKITYEGMFPNGKIFDANLKRKKPFLFRLGTGDVVRGMDLGMQGMRVGGSREIMIPSELG